MLPNGHPDVANKLNSLGLEQWHLRDFVSARRSFEEALSIWRTLPGNHELDIAHCLNNLGNIQHDLNDNASARKSYLEALAIRRKALPKDHVDIASSLNNLGSVEEDRASARDSFAEAVAIYRKAVGPDDAYVAIGLDNLGTAQNALGDYAAVRKSHLEALTIRQKVLSKTHPDIGKCFINLAIVDELQGNYRQARADIDEGLATWRKSLPKGHPLIAKGLSDLGRLMLLAETQPAGAVPVLEEAADLYQAEQLRMSVSQAEQEQLATAAASHSTVSHLVCAALRTKAYPGPIYDRVLRVKGGVTAQLRSARQARDNADAETKHLLDRLQQVNEQALSLSIVGGSPPANDNTALIEKVSSERGSLERQLTERSRAYQLFQQRASVDAKQIRGILPPQTALVDIIEYDHLSSHPAGKSDGVEDNRVVAFVLRRTFLKSFSCHWGRPMISSGKSTHGVQHMAAPDGLPSVIRPSGWNCATGYGNRSSRSWMGSKSFSSPRMGR